ncbi:MAG: ATP-binding protein [Gallionella sp.]|nr:ATP-binding protein [Gallionella sp.]
MSKSEAFRRPQFATLLARLGEPRRHIQVVAGPRQVGKTTLVRQITEAVVLPVHMASADEPALRDRAWLVAQWEIGRLHAREAGRRGAVLALDEIQKIGGWSETVKRLWDEDTAARSALRVVLLGSLPLLVQRGLTESLAGRFELVRLGHWTYAEMRDAFGWSLEQFVYFGGYPGAASLIRDEARWSRYILDSLVETTLSRDVLLLSRVDKPALLRQLFQLACEYSAQVVAYTKLVGQLQDAGNTTTLAHYLELLAGAGMAVGLQKFSGSRIRQRGSSPKIVALNTALVSASVGVPFREARATPELWGRLVETAVGAHLIGASDGAFEVRYWRDRNREVDYVLRRGRSLVALEVTSGRRKEGVPGLTAFIQEHPRARPLLVGGQGIPIEEFLLSDPRRWLEP